MDLLSQLREAPAPRPEAVARQVARRVDRPLAMLAFGLLYFGLFASYVVLGAGYGLLELGGYLFGSPPWWFAVCVGLVLLAVLWLAFWPFRWWKRRRALPALELGRNGTVLEGELAAWRQRGRVSYAVIWFSHGGREHGIQDVMSARFTPASTPVGTPIPVLYAPTSRRALYFAADGAGLAGRVHDKPEPGGLAAATA